jgi:putative Holliday junction resolvase
LDGAFQNSDFRIWNFPVRTLGIDYGLQRTGLALSDEGGMFATPLDVLETSSCEPKILKLIESESVQRLVVGLPLNMDDSIGPQAKQTIAWARNLAKLAGKSVIFVDERLSSFAAEQKLIDRKRAGGKMTRGQKKQRLDAHAAADFLQAFLDGRLSAIEISP